METVFGINLVALAGNQPKLFSLPELLDEFVRHRREVITRRTLHELAKARSRAHVLEGLAVALSNIDEFIGLIKSAASPQEAKTELVSKQWPLGTVMGMLDEVDMTLFRPVDADPDTGLDATMYRLTEAQAQAILDLRLHRLTSLEQEKIHTEYRNLLEQIRDFLDILSRGSRLITVIKSELIDIRERYGCLLYTSPSQRD